MSKINNIDRRAFIYKASTLIAVAVSLPTAIGCHDHDDTNPAIPPIKDDCITTTDILGPFYKAGAPFREDITPDENTGAPLFLSGKVCSDCDTVLKDAVVEIWNANINGEYDNTTFKFRGQFKTKSDGTYKFKTIIPGKYLNGATYRPSHIHFRITAPGHAELVSQIYFKDDPYIKTDPWASDKKALERILMIGKDAGNADTITFDIYLTRNV